MLNVTVPSGFTTGDCTFVLLNNFSCADAPRLPRARARAKIENFVVCVIIDEVFASSTSSEERRVKSEEFELHFIAN